MLYHSVRRYRVQQYVLLRTPAYPNPLLSGFSVMAESPLSVGRAQVSGCNTKWCWRTTVVMFCIPPARNTHPVQNVSVTQPPAPFGPINR